MLHGLSAIFLYSALLISFVFEGGQEVLGGTGFFVGTGSRPPCFITNRHVITEVEKLGKEKKLGKIQRIIIKGKSSSGEPQYNDNFVFDAHEWNVAYPKNNDDDVAVLCGIRGRQEGEPVFIEREMLATARDFESEDEIGVLDSVAFSGYPAFMHDVIGMRPIFRTGTIASDPRYGTSVYIGRHLDGKYIYQQFDNAVAYEAFSFGGSSGSPVFALQKGIPVGKGLKHEAYRRPRLIGINVRHNTLPDDIRKHAGEHSGLSYFFKSSVILEILDSMPKG